jgi:TRAP-type mannitol/chloroaromatic compound transport system permease small subunit
MTVSAQDISDVDPAASGPAALRGSPGDGIWAPGVRIFALSSVVLVLPFLINNYLIFWRDWPGVLVLYADLGWFGLKPATGGEEGAAAFEVGLQLFLYLGAIVAVIAYVWATRRRGLSLDADRLSAVAAYIVRAAFWAVLLVGLVDMVISFLRVEGFLAAVVGDGLTTDLGLTRFRGTYVHYPLVIAAFIIALFTRSLGFIWLALLIVLAEILIVISRFIFSYEQAFMGDLVRFWYAALFLFASAYTLVHEGHVRVDILYTRFSERGKAWCNALGSLVLGMPLCWIILTRGMWGKANIINAPLLSFEVSQSGYGMYVKYLMASFLVIYAVSMLVQFGSYVLSSAAILLGESHPVPEPHRDAL